MAAAAATSWPPARLLRVLVTAAFVATLAACTTLQAPPCPSGQVTVVQELLYFGTDMPAGHVTAEDWAQFLREAVTPRFPEGLTAWPATGQWRSASGAIVHEPSYVLSLVHPEGLSADKAIEELVSTYKARFRQEAVLRVKSHACMSV